MDFLDRNFVLFQNFIQIFPARPVKHIHCNLDFRLPDEIKINLLLDESQIICLKVNFFYKLFFRIKGTERISFLQKSYFFFYFICYFWKGRSTGLCVEFQAVIFRRIEGSCEIDASLSFSIYDLVSLCLRGCIPICQKNMNLVVGENFCRLGGESF